MGSVLFKLQLMASTPLHSLVKLNVRLNHRLFQLYHTPKLPLHRIAPRISQHKTPTPVNQVMDGAVTQISGRATAGPSNSQSLISLA